MKTKLFSLLLALTASLMNMYASVELNGLWYLLDEDGLTATVTWPGGNVRPYLYKPSTYTGDIVIPSSVSYEGKEYRVTSIKEVAFFKSVITSVTLPEGLTEICHAAFMYCSNLTSLVIPNSVQTIQENAFCYCYSLETVVVGENVQSLGSGAFGDCFALQYMRFLNPEPATYTEWFTYNNGCRFYVPCGTQRAYQVAWYDYKSRIGYEPLTFSTEGNVNIPEAGTVSVPTHICSDTVVKATANYGYRFVEWEDGVTDNPRPFRLTQDTVFTALFAALPRYTVSVQSGQPDMGTTEGDTAVFYGEPTEISATAYEGYHFTRWTDGNTANPRIVTVTRDTVFTAEFEPDKTDENKDEEPEVNVEPEDNSVQFTWPSVEGACYYTLIIWANEERTEKICTLTFNSMGQLVEIDFSKHAPARRAKNTTGTFSFRYNGLDENTDYWFTMTASDENDTELFYASGSFATIGANAPTNNEDVQRDDVRCTKVLRNGQIIIRRDDAEYTIQGNQIK